MTAKKTVKKRARRKQAGVLIQTRITPELASWVDQQAANEGFTIALWLRRLILAKRATP